MAFFSKSFVKGSFISSEGKKIKTVLATHFENNSDHLSQVVMEPKFV